MPWFCSHALKTKMKTKDYEMRLTVVGCAVNVIRDEKWNSWRHPNTLIHGLLRGLLWVQRVTGLPLISVKG